MFEITNENIRIDNCIKSDRWKLEQVDWVSWDGEFSNNEMESIINYCDRAVDSSNVNRIYGGRQAALSNLGEISFIKDRISDIAQRVNREYFRFNISNTMQIGYIKLEKDEYLRWHMDNVHWVNKTEDPSNIIITPKKLSMVLQLSGEDEYEGGEFKVVSDGGEYTAKKKKGIFNIFPGYLVHRVTPVTSGIRRVLQVWCVGPNFK